MQYMTSKGNIIYKLVNTFLRINKITAIVVKIIYK